MRRLSTGGGLDPEHSVGRPGSPDHGSHGPRRFDEGPPISNRSEYRDYITSASRRRDSLPRDRFRRADHAPISLNVFGDVIVAKKPREVVVYFDSHGNTFTQMMELRLCFGINRAGRAYVVYRGNGGEAYYNRSLMRQGQEYPAEVTNRGHRIMLEGGRFFITFVWGVEWQEIVVRLVRQQMKE